VKAGGRVVKNVAGYDICKLQIGALGTLGIITQVTLKVKPRPESSAVVFGGCRTEQLSLLLDRIHGSTTRPICIEVLDYRPLKEVDFAFHIGYEDKRETVAWQLETIRRELQPEFTTLERTDSAAERDLDLLANGPTSPMPIAFKANLIPAGIVSLLQLIRKLPPMSFQAHAGNGIVMGSWADTFTKNQAEQLLTPLGQLAVSHHGNLVITRCPVEWKRELPIWGEPRSDWGLMKKVKQAIDPKNLFNPGRFVVG
jgi:glycolate oxidase FAD binding subunit